MKVTVRPYLFLREMLGFKERVIDMPEGAKVVDLIRLLHRDYELADRVDTGGGKLTLFEGDNPVGLLILLDGCSIKQLEGKETLLKDGAVVALFPPAAGG